MKLKKVDELCPTVLLVSIVVVSYNPMLFCSVSIYANAELLSEPKTVGKVHWQFKLIGNQSSSSGDADQRDFNDVATLLNSVVYGLPHLALAS